MPSHRYEIRFGREGGCPMAVLQDMARIDRATLLSVAGDHRCEPGHIRAAKLLGQVAPDMTRWATFLVGATLKSHEAPPPHLTSMASPTAPAPDPVLSVAMAIPEHASRMGSGRPGSPRRALLLWEELSLAQRQAVIAKALPGCHPSNIPAHPVKAVWGVLLDNPGSLSMSIGENQRLTEIRDREGRAKRAAREAKKAGG